ncbi:hypothetical protein K8I28_04905 [bacterium]|nr:hypothetical protein [bacterium]
MKNMTIESLIAARDASSAEKPVLATVVQDKGNNLDTAIEAYRKGWVKLLLLGNTDLIKQKLQVAHVDPADCIIEQTDSIFALLTRLHDWCVKEGVDVLLAGDLSGREISHLLTNPYHQVTLEGGLSRACVLSLPNYPKLLTIIGGVGSDVYGSEFLTIHLKNSVHLTKALKIKNPKIALLSAMDQVGIDDMHTYDCQCLINMVNLEQIEGINIAGPMSFDTAVNRKAASYFQNDDKVSGDADVIIVDSHQTRSVLALTLTCFGAASAARVLLGGRIPVAVIPGRGTLSDKIAGIALALEMSPYLRFAVPQDWLSDRNPIDYVWK